MSIKKSSGIPVGYLGGSKHGDISFDKILAIRIPELLMNLMSFHEYLSEINSVVILKCHKRMLENYFSKGFTILEWNDINLEKLPNKVKERIHAEEAKNSDKVMTCITTNFSTSNTLMNLVVNKSFIISIFRDNSMIKRKK